MTKQINSNVFNFNFFLSNRIKVNSLKNGALKHGGATQYNDGIYSNIEGNEFININKDNNRISIFIPSTVNVNQKSDNSNIINYSIRYLQSCFNTNDLIYYSTSGSWYSEDNNSVVIEDITIITLDKKDITEDTIQLFIYLANYIKKAMQQEGVSIAINTALAIV